MKKFNFSKYLLLVLILGIFGCNKSSNPNPNPNPNGDSNGDSTQVPPKDTTDNTSGNDLPTYKEVWTVDTIDKDLIHFTFSKYYQPQAANQVVNVLRLNLNSPNYKLRFVGINKGTDSLSSVAKNYNAIAGVNGSFGRTYSFVKVDNNVVYSINSFEPGRQNLHWWAWEGAFFYNSNQDLKIDYGTKDDYVQSTYQNIATGGAVLVDDGKPVGETFIGDVSGINLNSLDYSDYRRIMGVRHPRTAIALTKDNYLLLIAIDGRSSQSAGMSAKEVTQFISKYFSPQYMINMDGGGSTTMYIKGRGGANGVVNYPSDNGKPDHLGQRMLYSFILIEKTK